MTLEELDRNAKFGYRRRRWEAGEKSSRAYVAFNYDRPKYTDGYEDYDLSSANKRADDWYLSDIPNMYYDPALTAVSESASKESLPKAILVCEHHITVFNNKLDTLIDRGYVINANTLSCTTDNRFYVLMELPKSI